ncbi:MAG: hypothetical protein ACRYFK_14400 [Janthinobacterium lividum]
MRILTLKADDGEILKGKLPDSWAEVPLAPYAQLAAAESLPARVEALAALVGLPVGPLLEDVSLSATIFEAAPWLQTELPEATGAMPEFAHLGVWYAHVGHLEKISAGQMEALTDFLQASEGHPLSSAPGLLAVLYCPREEAQTREVVRAAAQAFASLPMSVAWPCLADFTRSSGPAALSIQTAGALASQTRQALSSLEQALASGGSGTFWQKLLRSRAQRWLANVQKML